MIRNTKILTVFFILSFNLYGAEFDCNLAFIDDFSSFERSNKMNIKLRREYMRSINNPKTLKDSYTAIFVIRYLNRNEVAELANEYGVAIRGEVHNNLYTGSGSLHSFLCMLESRYLERIELSSKIGPNPSIRVTN